MIGPRWLTAADSRGERRLSRADDYVRLEVETALGRNIRVVPALVAGASMPVADDLPGTLEHSRSATPWRCPTARAGNTTYRG